LRFGATLEKLLPSFGCHFRELFHVGFALLVHVLRELFRIDAGVLFAVVHEDACERLFCLSASPRISRLYSDIQRVDGSREAGFALDRLRKTIYTPRSWIDNAPDDPLHKTGIVLRTQDFTSNRGMHCPHSSSGLFLSVP